MIRSWSNQQADSGSVHCFGNGNFLIYAQGPNLSQVEGPPYSMPSFCSLAIGCKSAQAVMSESQREKGIESAAEIPVPGRNFGNRSLDRI